MAQLPPIPPTQPIRMSQLLPTVKCSSCAKPVPFDQLGDHVCPSTSPPSNLPSGTVPTPPRPRAQTAPRPSSNAPPRSPIDMFFPRRRPSANPPPQDIPVRDRDGNGARLRGSASSALLRGAPGPAPAPAPARNGVRTPSLHSTAAAAARPVLPPPSRAQSPLVPPPSSSSSASARRPTSRPEMAPNGVVPRIGTRSPGPAPSHLDTRPRRPSVAQSPPHAPSPIQRRPSAPQSPPVPSTIQRRPSAPQSPPHVSSPIQRRPSAPQSPPHAPSLIQRRPSVPQLTSNYGTVGDPRSAQMPQPNHRPVRTTPSPAPSNYSLHSFVSPELDTQSGGAAGMAGVGRRGFAAVARAAMFATSPTSRLQQPTAELPAPWVPGSSPPQSVDNYRIKSPPLPTLEPPSGMSSFVHFTYIRRCDLRGLGAPGSHYV